MAQSPLFIESLHLSVLEWKENAELSHQSADEFDSSFEIKSTVENHPTDKSLWKVTLVVNTVAESAEVPISFLISYTGAFRVAPKFPSDHVEALVTVNGSSILYASAREMILQLSGRSFFGAIMLPSVSFVDLPKDMESVVVPPKTKKAARSSSPKARPRKPAAAKHKRAK